MTKQKVCSSVSSSKESVQTRINTWSQKYIGCVIVDVYAYVFYTDSKSDMQSKIVVSCKNPTSFEADHFYEICPPTYSALHTLYYLQILLLKNWHCCKHISARVLKCWCLGGCVHCAYTNIHVAIWYANIHLHTMMLYI